MEDLRPWLQAQNIVLQLAIAEIARLTRTESGDGGVAALRTSWTAQLPQEAARVVGVGWAGEGAGAAIVDIATDLIDRGLP